MNTDTENRQLVTIRTIEAVEPIPNAENIESVVIGGWKVVVKKNEFKAGDTAIYFEIDSFLPEGNPAWQFLIDKSSRIFNGAVGHRLRTIKLRGALSQGLVLRPSDELMAYEGDLSHALGITKWEAPLYASLVGHALGLFPSYIRKTDQPRCQNIVTDIFGYGEEPTEYSKYHRASPEDLYEVTMKLDGSSMTAYGRVVDKEVLTGVCSRNLELKVNDENADNFFVKTFVNSGIKEALTSFCMATGRSIALQSELMGPGIQGNREQLQHFEMYLFDIFDITTGEYVSKQDRLDICKHLIEFGAKLKHVPVLHDSIKLDDLGINNIADVLAFAEGPSIKHPIREGLVFKRTDGKFSFKAISNKFLEKEA